MAKLSKKMSANVGKQMEDVVSGMTGTATAVIMYMNGCVQYKLCPKALKDGVAVDGKWFDAEQLSISDSKKSVKAKAKPTGGPPPSSEPIFGQ